MRIVLVTISVILGLGAALPISAAPNNYDALLKLASDWRGFAKPPLRDGAPDYTAKTIDNSYREFREYRSRLHNIEIADWSVAKQVDWHLLRAEMNGYEFDFRVLKPWARDPAFYQTIMTGQSDVPTHAGPVHHAIVELWAYRFPLSPDEQQRLIRELKVIPPLYEQAQVNLTGNARDLWVAGIRNIQGQSVALANLKRRTQSTNNAELSAAIDAALIASDELAEWLIAQAPKKTGPSGVGKDNYTWYQQNVHYSPYTWEEEVTLLKRELARAWSSLKLEEARNQSLPPQMAASTAAELDDLTDRSAAELIAFLEDRNVMYVQDYYEPVLREHLPQFVPEAQRNFFSIVAHHDPLPLLSHSYHWIDLANASRQDNLSPIRREALLFNIYDTRSEGLATAAEEIFMNAGLYDDNPRSRELIWIMLAQRAARGLGSLYAHANTMNMAEAGTVHMEWTPRNWMGNEPKLLQYEQQLYLRQPGYGTSYVTGKLLIDQLIATRSKQMEGTDYSLADFFDEFEKLGIIPVTLAAWQLTGDGDEIVRMTGSDGQHLPTLLACDQTLGEYRWQEYKLSTEASLRGIAVYNQRIVWVTGTDGTIMRTEDAGKTWEQITIENTATLDFRDVEILSPQEVVVMSIGTGDPSRIYKTLDGGDTWNQVYQNPYEDGFFDGFAFWSNGDGMLGGDPIDGKMLLLKTADRGESWQQVDPDLLPPLYDGEYGGFAASGSHLTVNGDSVWVASGASKARVFISPDRGISWDVVDTPIIQGQSTQGIFSIDFFDSQVGVAVGGDYSKERDGIDNVILTSDGGESWELADQFPVFQSSVRYLSRSTIISVGPRGNNISHSGGSTWIPMEGRGYHSMDRAPDGTVWASGQDGAVARLIYE